VSFIGFKILNNNKLFLQRWKKYAKKTIFAKSIEFFGVIEASIKLIENISQ
jgi:hypothetical protein